MVPRPVGEGAPQPLLAVGGVAGRPFADEALEVLDESEAGSKRESDEDDDSFECGSYR